MAENDVFSALNVGSGLNTTELIKNLVDAEKAPKEEKINEKIETTEVSISAIADLKNSISESNSTIKGLDGTEVFTGSSTSASVSLKVTDPAKVSQMMNTVKVTQLAKAQTLVFDGFSSATHNIGSGIIVFEKGSWSNGSFTNDTTYTSKTVNIGETSYTITDVKDAINSANVGARMKSGGRVDATVDGGTCMILNRLTNDGYILVFNQAGTEQGKILSKSDTICIGSGDSLLRFNYGSGSAIVPVNLAGDLNDNQLDLGEGSARFDDIFATNGTIQTSDRNEKQDIEELTDAEKRVAVVAKGLMRKFRWKDKVAEKGDNARTHFGIIAQDLQDAFTAESLDASKYAMFCSDTWWEKEITVDAIEAKDAVLEERTDEDGNKYDMLKSEAVEAKDAYTYTDTKHEATEGYTEKTRLGVRYSELLAFIISAI